MKRIKVILALAMIFVMLASTGAFAAYNSYNQGVTGVGWFHAYNNLGTSTINTMEQFSPAGGVANTTMWITVYYNGVNIGSKWQSYQSAGLVQLTYDVARPSAPITDAGADYTSHQISANSYSWYCNLELR